MARSIRHAAAALAASLAVTLCLAAAPAEGAADRHGRAGPDPAAGHPPLSGELHAHDPAMTRGEDGTWYVFSTGDPEVADGTIQIRSSRDGREWEFAGTVWDAKPAWLSEEVPDVTNLWAPEIHEHAGTYYLYYAVSTFGSNRSVIALATNTTLDPSDPDYAWVDRGMVTESHSTDDHNAIDPGVVEDADGTPWLAFGSFWSGIRMLRLEWPSGRTAPGQGEPLRIADRQEPPNAIEAPFIVERGGRYYLFVSFGHCCQGTDSTYRIAVGRSDSVTGPYVDRSGRPMLEGGGTVILETSGNRVGPGGQSVLGDLLAYHYYDASADGDFRLGIERLTWTPDGWPEIVRPNR